MRRSEIERILNHMPKNQRKAVEDILTGVVTKQVICLKCNSHVADIRNDGKIVPTVNKNGVMKLLATRFRLDGFLGFQCLCGNDSRLAEQEKGIKGIEENSVTRNDLDTAFRRITARPSRYEEIDGVTIVDNFKIEVLG